MSHGPSLRQRVFSVVLKGLANACVLWEMAEEVDITLYIAHSLRKTRVEDWYFYGLFLFGYNVSEVNVLHSKISIYPLTNKVR